MIQAEKATFPVTRMAELLDVSTSGVLRLGGSPPGRAGTAGCAAGGAGGADRGLPRGV